MSHPDQASTKKENIYGTLTSRYNKSSLQTVPYGWYCPRLVMSCKPTLSQVSSSAALSHSKAFQFMSSREKSHL